MKYTSLFLLAGLLILFASCGNSQAQTQMNHESAPESNPMSKSEEEWKKMLTPQQYYVLREKGTEKPFTGELLMNKADGYYNCAACGNPLFASDAKFDSHCGWPSFDKEIAEGRIITTEDNSHGMHRTEITCAKCGGHLGHVFDDGPTDTGLRYCVNSASLAFEAAELAPQDTITLAGGCFWCMEAVFQQLKGVTSVASGFAGGSDMGVDYKEVCSGNTGHAEVVQVVFDPKVISLTEILKVFFTVHDPTQLNRQGADIGTQYRSAIFYRNPSQYNLAKNIIDALNHEKAYNNPVVTTLEAYNGFVKAEDYHQNYYNNNKEQGYCQRVIQPKLDKFEKAFSYLLKSEGH
jgi:peptide methionine sulfoxide reductase msrA/msrB